MSAPAVALADAVVSVLNAATLSRPFTAERHYAPEFDLADLAALRVTVVPVSLAMATLSRRDDDFEFVIHVAVQQRLDKSATSPELIRAACDPLMGFVGEVVDLFRGLAAEAFPLARFVGLENAPVYDPAHLYEKDVFTSLVALRFKKARPR